MKRENVRVRRSYDGSVIKLDMPMRRGISSREARIERAKARRRKKIVEYAIFAVLCVMMVFGIITSGQSTIDYATEQGRIEVIRANQRDEEIRQAQMEGMNHGGVEVDLGNDFVAVYNGK